MRPMGFVVTAALAALAFGVPRDVEARDRGLARRGYSHRYGYGVDTFRIGLDRGYDEGLRHGRQDGHRGRSYRFSDDRRYRRGDAGYRSSFGPRYEYARGFRSGYERGYRDGYRSARTYGGYERYGRHGYGRDRYYKDDPYRY